MKKRWLSGAVTAILAASMLTACGTKASDAQNFTSEGTASEDQTAAAGGTQTAAAGGTEAGTTASAQTDTVHINIESEPPTLCSLDAYDLVSFNVLRGTLEGLTKLDANNEVIPGIAESWDVSDDGTVYTFHLRDAKWSDGSPVTAGDFAFAWKKILSPDYGAVYSYLFYDIKGAQEYNAGTGSEDDVAVEAVDDKTLKVTLNSKVPYFDFLVSQVSFLPIPETFYESLATDTGNTYGTEADALLYDGPFVIDSWNHENEIDLSKNPQYYDASDVGLDSVVLDMVDNNTTAYDMFHTGQLDVVSLNTGDLMTQAEKDGYTVQSKSNGATTYLQFNTEDDVLKNAHIRKALSLAVNRQQLISTVLKDDSTPALTFTNPDITFDGKSYTDYVTSPLKDGDAEDAKTELAEGLKELGLSECPTITITIDDRDSVKTEAAVYQQQWQQNLGIKVEVQSLPYKTKLSEVQAGNYQIAISGWGPDYNDPSTFLEVFRSGSGMNDTHYASEDYDAALDAAKELTDSEERAKAYAKAEEILLNDSPIAPAYFSNTAYLVSDRLQGLVRTSFQDFNYNACTIK